MDIAFKSALGISVLGDALNYYHLFRKLDNQLIKRMYRSYVKREDVQNTLSALSEEVSKQHSSDVSQILKHLYNSLKERSSLSEKCLKTFGKYIPVRIVLFDEPYCTLSDNIPLEDYDSNDGEPFWMRPEYILEHYSKTYQKG